MTTRHQPASRCLVFIYRPVLAGDPTLRQRSLGQPPPSSSDFDTRAPVHRRLYEAEGASRAPPDAPAASWPSLPPTPPPSTPRPFCSLSNNACATRNCTATSSSEQSPPKGWKRRHTGARASRVLHNHLQPTLSLSSRPRPRWRSLLCPKANVRNLLFHLPGAGACRLAPWGFPGAHLERVVGHRCQRHRDRQPFMVGPCTESSLSPLQRGSRCNETEN